MSTFTVTAGARETSRGFEATQEGPSTPCSPFSRPITFTTTNAILEECLPLTPGATPVCPDDIAITCATGGTWVVGSGQVAVPVTFTRSPFTIVIAAAGAVICAFQVTTTATAETTEIVECPVAAGVTCTCSLAPLVCQGCRFDETGTRVICTFTSVLTLTCAAPAPTEIACIFVPKVYDFCFEEDFLFSTTVVPESCGMLPPEAVAVLAVEEVTCTTGPPVAGVAGAEGFAFLPVTITVAGAIRIFSSEGVLLCTFPATPVVLPKTVVVCHPDDRVTCDCSAFAAADLQVGVTEVVRVPIQICTIVECTAPVKLLVPSFGFCEPTRCTPAGFPPGFTCPPADLFPPQCTQV